jgi:UDP-N-acetylmuramoylalanine--D-glutamate ligase
VNYQRIVILGAGESGVGAALLAKSMGYAPFVSDSGKIKPDYKNTLLKNGISHEEGKHTESIILCADEVIKSPGIPDSSPLIRTLAERNIPVISEIEFSSRFTTVPIIAITGTNGKSTTALLTYHLLKEAGFKTGLAGNVGNSFARSVVNNGFDFYVLEISSFQLDGMFEFKAHISILLNITPDHLDRYNYNMDQYIDSKFRIVRNMTRDDSFIYCSDDPVISHQIPGKNIIPASYPVSVQDTFTRGAYSDGSGLHFHLPGLSYFFIPAGKIPLTGLHNRINTMCAVMACRLAGVSETAILKGLENFVNFPHRMEKIASINGIDFVNDSKATNVDAVKYALESYADGTVIWIAGGLDKGNDYDQIRDLVRRKVKVLVGLGKDNRTLIKAFENDIRIIKDLNEMKKAVRIGFQHAQKGDVILLSPACASFDLFKNYMDRGDKFKAAVNELDIKRMKKVNNLE